MKHILIIYGTVKGSTAEIATRIKGYLEEPDCIVEAMPADANSVALNRYDTVILGSGIYGGKPHKDIQAFVNKQRQFLSQKRVAAFAVCGLMCSQAEKTRAKAMKFADRVGSGLPLVSKTVFATRLPNDGWFGRVTMRLLWNATPGDHRDWDIVKDWTLSLSKSQPRLYPDV